MERVLYEGELMHFGVKGMKWGVRRYQNPDGSLTDKGKAKFNKNSYRVMKKMVRGANRSESKIVDLKFRSQGYRDRKKFLTSRANKFKTKSQKSGLDPAKVAKYKAKTQKLLSKANAVQVKHLDKYDNKIKEGQKHINATLKMLSGKGANISTKDITAVRTRSYANGTGGQTTVFYNYASKKHKLNMTKDAANRAAARRRR